MKITVAKTAGFCFGVRNAIKIAQEESKKSDQIVYTYGPLIHNNDVIRQLEERGIYVSILFCSIDFRNKFDVKQSQSVIAQIEQDYGRDLLESDDAGCVYGVFSNEDNTFRYYGYEHRKEERNEKYREFRNLYKEIEYLKKKKADKDQIDALEKELNDSVDAYLEDDDTISKVELMKSMGETSILSLSNSIIYMYYLCMIASIGGMIWAIGKGELLYTILRWIRELFV